MTTTAQIREQQKRAMGIEAPKVVASVKLIDGGKFEWRTEGGRYGSMNHAGSFDLFLIGNAWHKGCSFEDLADGFGKGLGTMGGDWSGIRDSSPAAIEAMLARALNHLDLH